MPVVDASVVVDWVVPDSDASGPARRFLPHLAAEGATVSAPRLPAGGGRERAPGRRPPESLVGGEADQAFGALRALPLRLLDEPRDLASAWELSRRYDEHPLYDLLYVALARRLGQELVTADARLMARVPLPFLRHVGG